MILCIWAIDNLTIYILKRLKSFPNAGLDRRRSSSTLPNASLPRQAWNYVILPGLVIHEMEFQNKFVFLSRLSNLPLQQFQLPRDELKMMRTHMVACLPSSKKPPTPCLRNCKEEPSHPSKKPRTKQAGWLTLVPISWNPFDLVPLCRKTLVMVFFKTSPLERWVVYRFLNSNLLSWI